VGTDRPWSTTAVPSTGIQNEKHGLENKLITSGEKLQKCGISYKLHTGLVLMLSGKITKLLHLKQGLTAYQ
jgi:hypothetical protein